MILPEPLRLMFLPLISMSPFFFTVIEALPPVVDTKMTAQNPHKKMSAADCAAAIVRAIEADQEEAAIGATKYLRIVANVAAPIARRIMIKY